MNVRHMSVLLFSFVLFSGVVSIGCAARPRPVSSPVVELRQPPPQPPWVGERAKVLVMGFGNTVTLDASVKRAVTDMVLGNGMRRHLVIGLRQTEQFAVLKRRGAKLMLTGQDFTPSGDVKRKAFEQIGSLDKAEFLIAGEVKVYQPSSESLAAGIEADPFFGSTGAIRNEVTAEARTKAFARLPAASKDRIVISVRLIDAAKGKTIGLTTVEGTPRELGQHGSGLFDEQPRRTSVSLQTPMQRALRACTMKAVNWIVETSFAYRQQAALRPALSPLAVENPGPAKKAAVEKKDQQEKLSPEPTAKKPALKVKPRAEKEIAETPPLADPSGEKPPKEKSAVRKPVAGKAIPTNETLQREEWGQ